MSWRTNKLVLLGRNLGRRLGINHAIANLLYSGYERNYDEAFSRGLHEGNSVWDVGANVGVYTIAYANKVGPTGSVCSFEPSPINFAILQDNCSGLSNVRLLNLALGERESELYIEQGQDSLGATSRIAEHGAPSQRVRVRTADAIREDLDLPYPNAVKIDVEGYEWEVLAGMSATLRNPRVKLVGIEVHFAILTGRGMEAVPSRIEAYLKDLGFRLAWPDSSHLVGVRS